MSELKTYLVKFADGVETVLQLSAEDWENLFPDAQPTDGVEPKRRGKHRRKDAGVDEE